MQKEKQNFYLHYPNPKTFPQHTAGLSGVIGEVHFLPDLLTEEELITFLRIPEVSKAADYHNVIENLKRMHGLPRIHICGKPLYPIEAIRKWIEEKTSEK